MTVAELITKLLELEDDEVAGRDSAAHVVAATTVRYEIVDVAIDRAGVVNLLLGVEAGGADPALFEDLDEWPARLDEE